MSDRKELIVKMHDLALANMPEGASHDEASCGICTPSLDHPHEGVDMKTYTEEEAQALIAEALAPLQAEVAELKAAQADSEVTAAVEAAKAEAAEELARVQAELDAAQIEKNTALETAEAAKAELEAVIDYLKSVQEEAEAAEELAKIKEERIAKVKEVAKFEDDEIAAKADRWAAMTEDDFAALVEDYKDVAAKAAAGKTDSRNGDSAMNGFGTETAELNEGQSVLSGIGEMAKAGYVPGRRV